MDSYIYKAWEEGVKMYNYESIPEKELARRAAGGDTKAFAVLYSQNYTELYRFALYMLGSIHDAEDAVSETVISAYEGISRLRKAESFKSWIFKILSNRCMKILRKRRREHAVKELQEEKETAGLCSVSPDFSHEYVQHQDVRDAFAQLREEERMIVSLSVFGGYSSEEIGKMLHMNAATVRSKKSRAFGRLGRALGGDGSQGEAGVKPKSKSNTK